MELLIRRVLVLGALALTGCVPDLDDDESVVAERRVLAVRAEPAEGEPLESSHYVALVGSPDGEVSVVDVDWAYCVDPKPVEELGPVSAECVAGAGEAIEPFGTGVEADGLVPFDTCSLFGPLPPLFPDGTSGRPTDPDVTGGYRIPVRLALPVDAADPAISFFEQRVQCGLAGASQADAIAYRQRYRRNGNPSFDAIAVVRADGSRQVLADGDTLALVPGEAVDLEVSWPECPVDPVCGDAVCTPDEDAAACPGDCEPEGTCGGSELYLLYDPVARELVERREAVRVSWLATAPGFEDARTGVGTDAETASSTNRFVAPASAGPVTFWFVLRDDRGGVSWRALAATVGP